MKRFSKIIAVLAALAVAAVLSSCSDGGSSDGSGSSSGSDSAVAGQYKGSVVGEGLTIYMILTVNGNGTWSSQGFTDSSFNTASQSGTGNGPYSGSGSTYRFFMGDYTIVGTTSDGWQTMRCSGAYTGTLTRM